MVVFGEDVAALFGLLFALVAVILSYVTGNPVYDSIGSIGIGVLLVFMSIFIAAKVKGLLIGQSADETVRVEIKTLLEARPEIESILNLITLQLGAQIMVATKAKMAKTESIEQVMRNINTCEKELKKAFPEVKWVFFEPDIEN